MEADGFQLPVIEAQCAYHESARYDDELEVRTTSALDVRRFACSSATKSCGPRTPTTLATGIDRCTRRSIAAAARAGCPSACDACCHEGAGHRRRRLHRIDARRAAARRRRRCRRHRLLHRLLSARDQGAEPRAAAQRHPRFRFVESRLQDADLPVAAQRSHACLSPRRAGRRPARAGGATSPSIRSTTSRRRSALLEACAGVKLERLVYASSSSVYGDHALAADARGRAAAAGVAVRRVEARGRTALLSRISRTTACRPYRCATSRSTDRGSGPTWPSTDSCSATSAGRTNPSVWRRRIRLAISLFVADAVSGDRRRRPAGRSGPRTILVEGRASR